MLADATEIEQPFRRSRRPSGGLQAGSAKNENNRHGRPS
jgi:hypothetical protein